MTRNVRYKYLKNILNEYMDINEKSITIYKYKQTAKVTDPDLFKFNSKPIVPLTKYKYIYTNVDDESINRM